MTSDLSNALCASRRKELLALINQLRAVGAQNDLDLPRITVIGNQSAGKSSVVEAISGITVPRDAGTCTRCPMECRLLSSTGPWTCQISIRKEFDSGGNRLREVSEIPFGGTITDKSQVELALRRAQFSVLNPGVPQKDVLNASPEKLKNMATQKSMPFSKNVVCVDLEGPGLTDLTFIDLPGLIQNADREIVQLVESMAISHISDNTIILVACPLTDDIENQKAFRLARQVDPHGHRSICVLTKPDMLTTGSKKVTQNWLDVLEGRRHTLMHGYYCTRQPDDDERTSDITLAKAREVEELFFKQTSPWSKSTTPGRLGAENLVVALSRLLINVIQESLPEIITDTDKRLVACREELSRLPPLLTEDPSTYLLSHIGEFCSAFQSSVEGSLETPLIQSHRAIYKTLKVAIRETAPHFIPFLENEKSVAFEDTEDEDEDELRTRLSNVGRCSKNLTDIRNHISRSVTRELPNNIPFPAKVALIREFQTTWSQCVGKCFEEIRATTLAVLMDKIIQHFGRFQALQARLRVLITEIVKKNHAVCALALSKILEVEMMPFTQNTHYLQAKTEVWLNKYKSVRTVGKGLPSRKSDIDISSIETPNAGQKEPPAKSLGYHSTLLSTLPAWHSHKDPVVIPRGEAHEFFYTITAKEEFSRFSCEELRFHAYSAKRYFSNNQPAASPDSKPSSNSSTSETEDAQFKTILAMLAQAGLNLSKEELLNKVSPSSDGYEIELTLMAEVRGYYTVAYKRLIDYVPGFIDLVFVRGIEKELQSFLVSELKMGTPAGSALCASLLEEDPSITLKRNELVSQTERLANVQRELVMFGIRR